MQKQILKLNEITSYQNGAIVSKMLLNKKNGSLTIFSFTEGEGLSEHTAPFDALALIIDGEANITIENEEFVLGQGELIIMPANKPHAVKALKNFKMMLVMIKD